MKSPKWESLKQVIGDDDDKDKSEIGKVDKFYDMLISSVEHIYDGETTYKPEDESREEIVEFFDSMNEVQFGKIKDYFLTLPKLQHEIKFECDTEKCKYKNTIKLEGLKDFLA